LERRQFVRVPVSLQIKFASIESLENVLTAATSDMSMGGLFIKTNNPRPVGTKVQIQIPNTDGAVVTLNGLVKAIRYKDQKPLGMGIEFLDVDGTCLECIREIMAKAS
jgi:c-di-GMP-binding flagellar brake protein YcgR